MHSDAKTAAEKRKLDRQLDEELEATFPASDAPKVTRPGGKAANAPAPPEPDEAGT